MFYSVVKVIIAFIFRIIFRIKVEGEENIPPEGRLVVCSNHFSNWDPLVIAAFFKRKISWMGKKELFEGKILKYPLSWLGVFPVDRHETDITAVKTALKILKDERVLGIFPEGTRVKEYNPDNAKSGVALLALRSKAPVLPIYIKSNYKYFKPLTIVIGEAIDYTKQYPGKLDNEQYNHISKDILKKIYELGGK